MAPDTTRARAIRARRRITSPAPTADRPRLAPRRGLTGLLGLAFVLMLCLAHPATAQELSLDLGGDGGSISTRGLQMIALITVLSLAPGILIMVTSFPFLVTVLSILRQALGLQASPPNMLLVSLALFLTYYIMEPTAQQAWDQGLNPLLEEQLTLQEAWPLIIDPFRSFMAARIDPNTFEALAALRPTPEAIPVGPEAPLAVLVPSFMLSEVARAFQIGFMIFLPFLIIDLVVAAVLMSMGMMMVPPAVVSLPFKLAFFVVANGWSLIASSLVRSYMT